MVLSNPDQLDAFEPKPEGEMTESSLVEGIADDVRALVVDKHYEERRAFEDVIRKRQVHLGRNDAELATLHDEVTNLLNERAIAKTAAHAKEGKPAVGVEHSKIEHDNPEGWLVKWQREHDR